MWFKFASSVQVGWLNHELPILSSRPGKARWQCKGWNDDSKSCWCVLACFEIIDPGIVNGFALLWGAHKTWCFGCCLHCVMGFDDCIPRLCGWREGKGRGLGCVYVCLWGGYFLNTCPLQETKEASFAGQPGWLRFCLCCCCQRWSLIIHRPEACLALSCVWQHRVSVGNIQPFCVSVWGWWKEKVAVIVCIFHVGILEFHIVGKEEHAQGHDAHISAKPMLFQCVYMFAQCFSSGLATWWRGHGGDSEDAKWAEAAII